MKVLHVKTAASRVKSALVTVMVVTVHPAVSVQNRVIAKSVPCATRSLHKKKPPLNRVALTLQRKPSQLPASH